MKSVSKLLERKGRHVHTVAPDTPVVGCATLMLEHSIGSLVVCKNGKPVGIVTRNDIVQVVAFLALGFEQTPKLSKTEVLEHEWGTFRPSAEDPAALEKQRDDAGRVRHGIGFGTNPVSRNAGRPQHVEPEPEPVDPEPEDPVTPVDPEPEDPIDPVDPEPEPEPEEPEEEDLCEDGVPRVCNDYPDVYDSYGDGCYWYDDFPGGCGSYDHEFFTANEMCCSCGGGYYCGEAP